MRKEKAAPICNEVECANCETGRCTLLSRNDFNKRCPFYKTKEQAQEENAKRVQRLFNIEREVDYYGT